MAESGECLRSFLMWLKQESEKACLKLNILKTKIIASGHISSVAKSCLTVCSPMNCSMPGFPVLQYLLEFAQTRVSIELMIPSNCLILCHPLLLLLSIFSSIWCLFQSQLFTSGSQSIGASASVLPVNIQG